MKFVAIFSCFAVGMIMSIGFAQAQIQLNEVLADPASDWDGDSVVSSKSDEWVEVINVGASAVDVSCFRLGDASGGTTWRFGFSGTLAPGDVVVVYGSDAVAWQGANGFPSFGLSLNNSGETVFLFDISNEDTVIVDEYTYANFEVLDDRSVGRDSATGEWVIFDGLNPYTGDGPPSGTGCHPSPGTTNECSTVPTHDSTWGAIKQLYE